MCHNLGLWFFLFIAFCQVFFPPLFAFWLSVLLPFLFFRFGFLSPFVSLLFHSCFVPVFFAHVVSSLGYLNLLENKRLGCCCCCLLLCKCIAYVKSKKKFRYCPSSTISFVVDLRILLDCILKTARSLDSGIVGNLIVIKHIYVLTCPQASPYPF
jgi:hypothetical protein